MSLHVIKPGMLVTVQDLGRYGYQQYGMPVAGAMDEFALRAANLLVGNDESAAALEITLLGPKLEVRREMLVAVTGADLSATLDGRPLPLWQAVPVRKGAQISFGTPREGARAYLAVSGGIDVPLVLGSRSTYLRGKLGGFQGRALMAGDEVPVGESGASVSGPYRRLPRRLIPPPVRPAVIRIMPGPQDDLFLPESLEALLAAEYTVSRSADRMGYRLEGPKLEHRKGADIISDAIPPGAVQVPGHGTPIVMLADRQTTGGYTKIATVISADLRLMAQLRPGDALSFKLATPAEAVAALREQRQILNEIRTAAPAATGLFRETPHMATATELITAFGRSSASQMVYEGKAVKLELRR